MREDIDVYNHLKSVGLKFDLITDVGVGMVNQIYISHFFGSIILYDFSLMTLISI